MSPDPRALHVRQAVEKLAEAIAQRAILRHFGSTDDALLQKLDQEIMRSGNQIEANLREAFKGR